MKANMAMAAAAAAMEAKAPEAALPQRMGAETEQGNRWFYQGKEGVLSEGDYMLHIQRPEVMNKGIRDNITKNVHQPMRRTRLLISLS